MDKVPSSQPLVVERQQIEVGNSSFGKEQIFIDIPILGPHILTDSVMAFLNEQLYKFCEEQTENSGMNYDSLYINNSEKLLRHYVDAYRPLVQEKGGWLPTLYITMLAQTESFITYCVACKHNKSDYAEMYCYTFSKQDGHRLREIISHENLDKFFDEHKEHRWLSNSVKEIKQDIFGLIEDTLLFVNNGLAFGFYLNEFGYSEILPYLSEDAKYC